MIVSAPSFGVKDLRACFIQRQLDGGLCPSKAHVSTRGGEAQRNRRSSSLLLFMPSWDLMGQVATVKQPNKQKAREKPRLHMQCSSYLWRLLGSNTILSLSLYQTTMTHHVHTVPGYHGDWLSSIPSLSLSSGKIKPTTHPREQ